MRKWMIAGALLFNASAAMALNLSWQLDGEQFQSAHTPAQFRMLARMFPTLFREDDAEEVVSASVTTAMWSLVGITKCAASDDRAHTRTVGVMICTIEPGEPQQCAGNSSPGTPGAPEADPCAND